MIDAHLGRLGSGRIPLTIMVVVVHQDTRCRLVDKAPAGKRTQARDEVNRLHRLPLSLPHLPSPPPALFPSVGTTFRPSGPFWADFKSKLLTSDFFYVNNSVFWFRSSLGDFKSN